MDPTARATFSFEGTSVRWIGYRDEWSGRANVYLDGELKATVDTFASPSAARATLFAATGLAPGAHALTLAPAGTANAASRGLWVWADAFDVVERLEQDRPEVTLSGDWVVSAGPAHSGGSAAASLAQGARATFAFNGSAVSWIGYRDEWCGIAHVYLDGEFRAEIDTYAPPLQARAQAVIYSISGLPPGPHTIAVEVERQANPLALAGWVWVDGFETPP
jgi:hypothetical protein